MGIWDRLSRRLGELSEELLPDTLREEVESARKQLEAGDPHKAAAALERAVMSKPDHATALHLLGIARLRLGELVLAEQAFASASLARAGFAEALVGLGEARLEQGDARGAVLPLREALDHAESDHELLAAAFRGLGRAYLALGEREKGLRELRKALGEDPSDPHAAALLADAVADGPPAALEQAWEFLERGKANTSQRHDVQLSRGRLALRMGKLEEARDSLERAVALAQDGPSRARALVLLADAALADRDACLAHECLLRALQAAPGQAWLHERLGDLHMSAQNAPAALAAYDCARALGDLSSVKEKHLLAAASASDDARALALATEILARSPHHSRALLAKGMTAARTGELGEARQLLGNALAHASRAERPDVLLAQAELALASGEPALAVDLASDALNLVPMHPQGRAILVAAKRKQLGLASDPPKSTLALGMRIQALLESNPSLRDLGSQVSAALESYDRPLMVTVMGEFSSGKSTFVNAFLGVEVAPSGSIPTTAANHVLKYAHSPSGRIIYLDGDVREIAWPELPLTLRALSPEEARRVHHVEILYPAKALLAVNIVDTPGLNSILSEHEEVARQFVVQADAVAWLLACGQAGKRSEREALEHIRAQGKRVLGVVSKIDQVSPSETGELCSYLKREMGDVFVDLIPVCARLALQAKQQADASLLARSQWPALEAALDRHFFLEARTLKQEVLRQRLHGILETARSQAVAEAESARKSHARLHQEVTAAADAASATVQRVISDERRHVAEGFAAAYRHAAVEVLELVRPRHIPFGSHRATSMDRDYLLGLLERELTSSLGSTRRRIGQELAHAEGHARRAAQETAGAPASAQVAVRASEAKALIEARVVDRFCAYVRGYLRGGRLDDFFARTLPRLDLSCDSVHHALFKDAPDLDELLAPLAAHLEEALCSLTQPLVEHAEKMDLTRHEAEEILIYGIESLQAGLSSGQ
ncbi:MAG: dynamin family protein [Deltaproteobacteria bacterium]|nr:dynamin family protein [Deltaproteobacteria bacterium]